MDITTERVEIPVINESMGGYLARPADGETRPAVIVFMEIFGINSHIRDVVERVAKEGYVALAPDFCHRTGPGVEYGYDDEGMSKGMALLGQLKADEMIADARGQEVVGGARPDVDGNHVGAMGFCIGGHMTYLTACTVPVQAAASFYGGGIAAPEGPGGGQATVDRSDGIRGKILCLFGQEDALIPQDQVETIRAALEKAGADHEIVVYPGADHGFFCDQRATYQEAAATDAWDRVKKLFASELA